MEQSFPNFCLLFLVVKIGVFLNFNEGSLRHVVKVDSEFNPIRIFRLCFVFFEIHKLGIRICPSAYQFGFVVFTFPNKVINVVFVQSDTCQQTIALIRLRW
jgi:hypothetical protein